MVKTDKDTEAGTKAPEPKQPKEWNIGGLFWGLLIILIGGMLLIDNLGIYDLNMIRIWQLWPIILVGIGVSMLSLKGIAAGLVAGLMILISMVAILYVTTAPVAPRSSGSDSGEEISIEAPQNLDNTAEVTIKTAAGLLNVSSSDDVNLADATLKSDIMSLNQENETINGKQKVLIEASRQGGSWPLSFGNITNELDVILTQQTPLDLTIDAGAAKIEASLENVRTKSIKVDAGASSAEVKLGDSEDRTDVEIDTGMSSFLLRIPEASGVRVDADGGLSSKDFGGLSELSKGVYESEGFDNADNKVYIKLDAGMSSFRIERY